MNSRIPVDLAGRGLEYAALQPLRQTEHVDGTVHRGLCRLHRIVLVMNRRCRAREIVDLVHFDEERKADIVPKELKARVRVQMLDIALGAREEIVDTQDIMPLLKEPVDQVRTKKPGTSSDQYTLLRKIVPSHAKSPLTKFTLATGPS
jgi:hypothetical protein